MNSQANEPSGSLIQFHILRSFVFQLNGVSIVDLKYKSEKIKSRGPQAR